MRIDRKNEKKLQGFRNKEVLIMKTEKERYVVDDEGKKTDIILSISKYDKLLEDLHDLAIIAERVDESPVSIEEMKNRLRKPDLL